MPDIAAKESNGGHGFKTSLMAGLEKEFSKVHKLSLRFLLCSLLQSCIQMDADADDHGEERIAFPGVDAHIMKMVIIEHPVIYPLAGSTVIVNCLIFLRPPCHGSIEADIPVRLGVDAASIGGGRAFLPAGAGSRFAAGKRTAPFAGMLLLTVPPVDHAGTSHTQGSAIIINGDGAGDGIRPAPVRVEVDKRTDIPFPAEPVGGIVVMCRVQADIPDRDIRMNGFKFPEGDDGADAVVSPGIEETDMQGQVNADFCIVGAEHIKAMSKIKSFLVAVPSPVGIGVREMTSAGTAGDAVIHTLTDFMPIRGRVGMDTGAVTGKGDAVRRNEPVPEGREDRSKTENLLKPFLIMKGEFLMLQSVSGQGVCNAGMPVGKFLPFAGFFGRFHIFILWEEILSSGLLGSLGLSPEPVHEVEIRSYGRKGIRSTAYERGGQTVCPEFLNPGCKAGKAEHNHKDKGTDDLYLIFSGPSDWGIESGKISHNRIKIQQTEFFADVAEFKMEPCALGRIKMYFCLMQEIQIFLMGLPVN